jgi:hypothetical protein
MPRIPLWVKQRANKAIICFAMQTVRFKAIATGACEAEIFELGHTT